MQDPCTSVLSLCITFELSFRPDAPLSIHENICVFEGCGSLADRLIVVLLALQIDILRDTIP
jgi:hypothetical protein